MASDSNTDFWNAMSFQSPAMSSSPEMIPVGNYFGASTSSTGIALPASSGMKVTDPLSGLFPAGNSSAPLLLDSVPGLKHDAGLSVEWTAEEQYKLEEGLEKFRDEPKIMKYIKIAGTLRDKTARDVALRCRWMKQKRRKVEEHFTGKKAGNRKVKFLQDKLVDLSPKLNMPSDLPQYSTIFPPFVQHMGENTGMPCEGLSDITMHLLQQNAQAFSQISSNLSTCKLQDNIDLFCRARNNLTAILNDMREMPGILSHMPPLPVSINKDLADSVLPATPQPIMFGLPAGIHPKHEPRS